MRRQPRVSTACGRPHTGGLLQQPQGNAELGAVWDLVAALWRRDYPVRRSARTRVASVPRAPPAQTLTRTATHQAIGTALRSPAFSPATADAVAACAAAHRKSTLHLLSVAYTTISVADTAEALALSQPEALAGAFPACTRVHHMRFPKSNVLRPAVVTAAGWQIAADDPLWLTVAPPAPTPEVATDAMSLQTLLGYAVAAGS